MTCAIGYTNYSAIVVLYCLCMNADLATKELPLVGPIKLSESESFAVPFASTRGRCGQKKINMERDKRTSLFH